MFLQVVQKKTLSEVETLMVALWPVVSGIPVPTTIKIWSSFSVLQSIMSGMFFNVFGSFQRVFRVFSPGSAEAHTG